MYKLKSWLLEIKLKSDTEPGKSLAQTQTIEQKAKGVVEVNGSEYRSSIKVFVIIRI